MISYGIKYYVAVSEYLTSPKSLNDHQACVNMRGKYDLQWKKVPVRVEYIFTILLTSFKRIMFRKSNIKFE